MSDISKADEFFAARQGWLDAKVVPRGDGWDVVLRIDGTYFDKETALEMADHFGTWVQDVTLDATRRVA